MKKTLSLLLAVLMVLTLLPAAAFAEGNPSASITVDKTAVSAGETVTVTVSLDDTIENVMLAEFYVHYDTSLFTRGTYTVGTALTGTDVSDKNLAVDGTDLKNDGTDAAVQKFSIYTFAYPAGGTGNAGTIATVTFTANADIAADTETAFKLEYCMMQDKSKTDITVETSADAAVTVKAASTGDEPTAEGYTVSMAKDKNVIMGETVSIPVTIGHGGDVTVYNAYDMTFAYDASILTLTTTSIENATLITGEGTLRVQCYGDEKALGEAFSLTFTTAKTGTANVTLTAAYVDIAANAADKDAPAATVTDEATAVTVNGYPVTLPEGFTADESVAQPNEDYTFSEPDDLYDYTIEVTVGGKPVDVIDNDDGSYTVPADDVTGEIKVTVTDKAGKIFQVILGTDMSSEYPTAQYMTDYTATLTPEDGYTYGVSVTIGNEEYKNFSVSENVYTIPGGDITGDIEFIVVKEEIPKNTYTVKFEGTGAGDVRDAVLTVVEGSNYNFTFVTAFGYDYEISATMGGEKTEATFAGKQGYLMRYQIANVTGDLVITINKTPTHEINVSTYVELDGKTVFLVTANGELAEGKTFYYSGTPMFYSEAYQAWCCLVVKEGEALTREEAISHVQLTTASFVTLSGGYDVNMSGTVDINDAQLTYDIYNGKYEDFNVVSMQKFLNADVNGDKTVNTADAAAVVSNIA